MSLNRSNVISRTAKATQLSTMTVKRIHKEFVIREGQDFYERKEYPTLSLLLDKVKKACGFPGGRYVLSVETSQRTWLNFGYKKS